ncbi:hypothetical protein MAH1_11390 [Sessilibacter sp. MAH1]
MRAWNKIESFKGESQFGTWLYRVTANVVISALRRSKAKLEEEIDPNTDDNQATAPLDIDGDLEKAIQKLPEGARAVLVLYSIEGYTHEEISEMLNIAVGTSKAQLHRARSALKSWFGDAV